MDEYTKKSYLPVDEIIVGTEKEKQEYSQYLEKLKDGCNSCTNQCATKQDARKIATAHVEWFLSAIKPLLIDNFVHGYKHGKNDKD